MARDSGGGARENFRKISRRIPVTHLSHGRKFYTFRSVRNSTLFLSSRIIAKHLIPPSRARRIYSIAERVGIIADITIAPSYN